jgi:hypothetical protein
VLLAADQIESQLDGEQAELVSAAVAEGEGGVDDIGWCGRYSGKFITDGVGLAGLSAVVGSSAASGGVSDVVAAGAMRTCRLYLSRSGWVGDDRHAETDGTCWLPVAHAVEADELLRGCFQAAL